MFTLWKLINKGGEAGMFWRSGVGARNDYEVSSGKNQYRERERERGRERGRERDMTLR